jgi:hypothetical protein
VLIKRGDRTERECALISKPLKDLVNNLWDDVMVISDGDVETVESTIEEWGVGDLCRRQSATTGRVMYLLPKQFPGRGVALAPGAVVGSAFSSAPPRKAREGGAGSSAVVREGSRSGLVRGVREYAVDDYRSDDDEDDAEEAVAVGQLGVHWEPPKQVAPGGTSPECWVDEAMDIRKCFSANMAGTYLLLSPRCSLLVATKPSRVNHCYLMDTFTTAGFSTKDCHEEAGVCVTPHPIGEDLNYIFSTCAGHLFLSTLLPVT